MDFLKTGTFKLNVKCSCVSEIVYPLLNNTCNLWWVSQLSLFIIAFHHTCWFQDISVSWSFSLLTRKEKFQSSAHMILYYTINSSDRTILLSLLSADYLKSMACEVQAFLKAIHFYRQEKGHYESWDMLMGHDCEVGILVYITHKQSPLVLNESDESCFFSEVAAKEMNK